MTRTAVAFGAALLFGAVALAAMHPIQNGDLGWHLAIGREIAQSGAVPRADFLTHTAAGAPMVAHEWLAQLGYYALASRVDILGLRWANAALLACAVPLVLLALGGTRRRAVAPALALCGTALWVVLAQDRLQVRVSSVNLPFAAALFAAVFHARGPLGLGRILAICGATALWANLHSGATIVAAWTWTAAAASALEARTGRAAPDATSPRRWAALAAGCTLALACTPSGFALFPYLLETARINRELSWEWLPLWRVWSSPLMPGGTPSAYIALCGLTAAATAFALRRRAPLVPLAIAWLALAMALSSVRFLWLTFPALAFALAELGGLRWTPPRTLRAVAPLLAVALGLAALHPPEGTRARLRQLGAASNFDPSHFPPGATLLLAEIPLEGKLYNPPHWGGFLSYTLGSRVLTFADGRWPTIGERTIRDAHAIQTRRPRAFPALDEWSVDLLLVERRWMRGDRGREAEWLPVFLGRNSALYLRRGERTRTDLERIAAYYAARDIPLDGESGFDPQSAARANPQWARAHYVGRTYFDHFNAKGRYRIGGRVVAQWDARGVAD